MRRACRLDIYCSSNKQAKKKEKKTFLKGCPYPLPQILDIPSANVLVKGEMSSFHTSIFHAVTKHSARTESKCLKHERMCILGVSLSLVLYSQKDIERRYFGCTAAKMGRKGNGSQRMRYFYLLCSPSTLTLSGKSKGFRNKWIVLHNVFWK